MYTALTGVSIGDAKLTATTPCSFSWSSATAAINTSLSAKGQGNQTEAYTSKSTSQNVCNMEAGQQCTKQVKTIWQHSLLAGPSASAPCSHEWPIAVAATYCCALSWLCVFAAAYFLVQLWRYICRGSLRLSSAGPHAYYTTA
eukprot:GHRR01013951.1.p1 GENE.GHRR01013951.1~~GHRR01013951.1.p1  ORF type:complete len:143 (-),score=33.74 GHRR01013951.1:1174-1602(-)